jgi:hypothetical protein
LSTIRAALLLLQEQIDALPEDLAEMIGRHRPPVTALGSNNSALDWISRQAPQEAMLIENT